MRRVAAACLLLAISAFSDEGELSNDEIINEIQSGTSHRKPNHFIFNVKPISFIVGQTLGQDAPYPMKCLQVKGRIYKSLGLQLEPVFIVGGHGGFGFTAGPSFFPGFPWDELHVTPKYELDYINRMGAYHGFLLELTRHRLFKNFVLSYGGAVGFGVSGASVSEDFDGNTEIREIEQGFAFDLNLGLGFAL